MAIIQIIVEINDKVNCTLLLTTRGWLACKGIPVGDPTLTKFAPQNLSLRREEIVQKYTAFLSFLFGKRLKSQTVRTELYLIYDCFSLNFLFFSSKTTFEWNVVVVYQSARPEETHEVV